MGQKKKTGVSPKTIKWIWYAALAPFALVALMLVLTVFGVFGRMPSFEELENPRSNLATEIYSEDGKVIGTFFVQNRSYVQYADLYPSDSTLHIRLAGHEVPPIVAALIATEDVRFRTHSGIDIPSLRYGPQPRRRRPQGQTRDLEVQGVDHGPQTRIQLHQGGDRRHVPQYGGVRLERLRHQVGGPHLLQQGAGRTQRAGGGRAGGGGERPDALFAHPESQERPRAPQPRAFTHGGGRGADPQAARFAGGAADRDQLQARVAQRGCGDLFPRDAAAGDERPASQAQPVLQRVGL